MFYALKKLFENTNVNRALRRTYQEGKRKRKKKSFGRTDKGERSSYVPEQKKKDPSHTLCYNCRKYGHYAKQCTSKKRKQHASIDDVDEENSPKKLRNAKDDDRQKEYFL